MTAGEFARLLPSGLRVADKSAAAGRLRQLADEIENGQVLLQNLRVSGLVTRGEFVATDLTLRLVEREDRPPRPPPTSIPSDGRKMP
jgi:hypothetical protein